VFGLVQGWYAVTSGAFKVFARRGSSWNASARAATTSTTASSRRRRWRERVFTRGLQT
jgi:hypothetical protein